MIRLRLELPEATIEYNSLGLLTSPPAAYAPDTIKKLNMRVAITGYVDEDDNSFFAFKMESRDRVLSVSEQLALLRALGFKTVPAINDERYAGDSLITIKTKFQKYQPEWVYANSGKVLATPEIVEILDCKWDLVNKGLTLQVTTDKGVFPVVDMRYLEFFQPHGKAKLADGKLQPYVTTRVTVPIPDRCPKCSNPLKRIQPYPDLPLFFRCTSKFCEQQVLDEPNTKVEPEQEVENPDSFREPVESETLEQPVAEQPVLDEVISDTDVPVEDTEVDANADIVEPAQEETTDITTHGDDAVTTTQGNICLVDSGCDESEVQALIDAGIITVTQETAEAQFILVKNRRSVTRAMRDIAKDYELELKPITDFQ